MKNENNSEVIRIDKTFTTQQVAENLGIGRSTLNKYCRSLEEDGYSFYKDDNDYRAYTEHDVMALRELKEMLSKNVDYNSAIKTISIKYQRDVTNINIATVTTPEESRFESRYAEFFMEQLKRQDEKIDQLIQVNRQMAEMMDAQRQLAVTAVQDNRQAKVTDWITQRRIELELEEEAAKLWEQKPENEKYKKKGWFGKKEDIEAKQTYMNKYILDNLEARLKRAYGIEE